MKNRSILLAFLFILLTAALFIFSGCEGKDINKQDSVSSGTSTGSGSSGSGGAPANVTIFPGNNAVAVGATTTITVIITDASGRRTDASVILTSARGGTFNGTNVILTGNTSGGIFIAEYKAVNAGDDTVTATVTGTTLTGTTIISAS